LLFFHQVDVGFFKKKNQRKEVVPDVLVCFSPPNGSDVWLHMLVVACRNHAPPLFMHLQFSSGNLLVRISIAPIHSQHSRRSILDFGLFNVLFMIIVEL
jgi:hypothetical protein